jgi:decaprenylphospho-beta-D-erythro-pentofuranosid-2-ulose 2-reductase
MSGIMVVGGGSEIACALVKELFDSGNYKALSLIGRKGLSMDQAVLAGQKMFGPNQVHYLTCDFADPAITASSVRQAMHNFKPAISVIAAGINIISPNSNDKAQMGLVNYVSMIVAGEEILRFNEGTQKTTLMVLSSIAAIRPRPSNYIYGSSKVALDFWARGAMANYPKSSEIILVRLGKVSTVSSQNHPWAPFTKSPDHVGKQLASLIGDGSKTVWIPKSLGLFAKLISVLPRKLWEQISTYQAKG